MFMAQTLSAEGSCRQAVDDAVVKRRVAGMRPCSSNTAAYCKARARLPLTMISTLARRSGEIVAGAPRGGGNGTVGGCAWLTVARSPWPIPRKIRPPIRSRAVSERGSVSRRCAWWRCCASPPVPCWILPLPPAKARAVTSRRCCAACLLLCNAVTSCSATPTFRPTSYSVSCCAAASMGCSSSTARANAAPISAPANARARETISSSGPSRISQAG